MGKLDLKLLQGIEEAEGQIRNDKQKDVPVKDIPEQKSQKPEPPAKKEQMPDKKEKNRELSGKQQPGNRSGKERKEESSRKGKKQVFSFRALTGDINLWKAYATATGMAMEKIGTAAMNEYVSRHRLSEAELAVFEALRARDEM